ncbi:MAG: four helix bundle protein [Pirellulaceae bacterium]
MVNQLRRAALSIYLNIAEGVGYDESWLISSIATACSSHHRQMVDERYKRPPQTSTAWRRWLRRVLSNK